MWIVLVGTIAWLYAWLHAWLHACCGWSVWDLHTYAPGHKSQATRNSLSKSNIDMVSTGHLTLLQALHVTLLLSDPYRASNPPI